jgi:hypothetical protein
VSFHPAKAAVVPILHLTAVIFFIDLPDIFLALQLNFSLAELVSNRRTTT